MKCPACEVELIANYREYINEGTLCEYGDQCPNGCYEADFAYGANRERIGNREWIYNYAETKEAERKRLNEQRQAILEARKGK